MRVVFWRNYNISFLKAQRDNTASDWMRNETSDNIQELIAELTRLQLQQTVILARLETARQQDKKKASKDGETGLITGRDFVFAIDNQVIIRNPGHFQTDRGTIVKIGKNRITVQTKLGTKIQRAPNNLLLNHE